MIPGDTALTPTWTSAVCVPAVTVMRAEPGATARMSPEASTVAVAGASLRHVNDGAVTISPALSRASTDTRRSCPACRYSDAGNTTTLLIVGPDGGSGGPVVGPPSRQAMNARPTAPRTASRMTRARR